MSIVLMVIFGGIFLWLIARGIAEWRALPHRCPSCDARFDEAKAGRFCRVAGKSVYFCHSCVSNPRGRLRVNTIAFATMGWSAEEIAEIQTNVDLYKH